jgi:hypothetical protein
MKGNRRRIRMSRIAELTGFGWDAVMGGGAMGGRPEGQSERNYQSIKF